LLVISTDSIILRKKKVKKSHYRPGQALRVSGVRRSHQDNQHMKVVSLSALRTNRLHT
jgi:hypothetical protein